MKTFWKILKWIGLSIGALLLLLMLSGLTYRLFGPSSQPPLGELVDIGSYKLHIHSTGEKNKEPTLVIEGGSGVATEYYHWLSEGLKDSMRVVRYDRAGIGHSDACRTPRDPETIARELHALLEKAGEAPPYILAGHSLGGPYIRVFTQLYPDEVVALLLLDATHPERVERFDLPMPDSYKFKSMIWGYYGLGVLGDLGLVGLYDRFMGPILPVEPLPDTISQRIPDFLLDGKLIWTAAKEMKYYHHTLKRAGEAHEFGDRPIRVFTAAEEMSEGLRAMYRERGIDPDQRRAESLEMQEEYTELSTDGQLFLLDGDHNSIYTDQENADIICQEVLRLFRMLSY